MKVEAKPKLQRVRKTEVVSTIRPSHDPLDECLACWRAWMAGDADRDLGAKTMRGLMGNSDGYGVDPAEAQQARDNRIAVATNAMIDSLKRVHIWAIYESMNVGTVWKFPNADLIDIYAAARDSLEEKLRRHFVTGSLF